MSHAFGGKSIDVVRIHFPAANFFLPLVCASTRFEVLQCFVTLLLCGLLMYLPAESASQVALSMIVSMGMAVCFANLRPYLKLADDVLAQGCQHSLTMVLIVGLLQMIAESGTKQNDEFFGIVLIALTASSMAAGFGLIITDFGYEVLPHRMEMLIEKMSFKVSGLSASRRQSIAPFSHSTSAELHDDQDSREATANL